MCCLGHRYMAESKGSVLKPIQLPLSERRLWEQRWSTWSFKKQVLQFVCQSETQHLPFEQKPHISAEILNVSFLLLPSSSKHLLSKVEVEKQTLITLTLNEREEVYDQELKMLYWHDCTHPQTAPKTAPQMGNLFQEPSSWAAQPTCSGQGAHSLGSVTSPSVGWLEVLVQVWTWNGTIPVILNNEIPSIWQRSLEHIFSLHFPKTDITLLLPIKR